MKVIKIKKVESCLEGAEVRDLILDKVIVKEFAGHLGMLGKFIYNDNFDKPFFKIIVDGNFTAKGSVGNRSFRIIFPGAYEKIILDDIISHINKY